MILTFAATCDIIISDRGEGSAVNTAPDNQGLFHPVKDVINGLSNGSCWSWCSNDFLHC